MTTRHLVFPYGIWDRCQQALFVPNGSESFLVGLARPCQRKNGVAYIVEQLLPEAMAGYEFRSTGGLTLSDAASSQINLVSLKAAKARLVPVHLHSHPPGVSDFSGSDDFHERGLHEWLAEHGQPLLWSLVWPYSGEPTARLWVDGEVQQGTVRAGLQPFGAAPSADLPALDRQRAFGEGLRRAAATLTVGIVGVGGVGFAVAEQLARSGFTEFLLIDLDHVDATNLNRLPGTEITDIGKRKVDVAKRLVMRAAKCIGARATVNARGQDIYTAPTHLRSELRQCDIILALTDNELSRITCLQIALEGGSEYLQAGVDIRLGEDGKIAGLFAEVTGAEVNRYCPLCTSRLDSGQASVEARRYVGGEVWERAKNEGYVPGVPAPAVMSLNAVAAGMLVLEIQRRVSGLGVRDLIQTDLQNATVQAFEHIENQLTGECTVCGRGETGEHAIEEVEPTMAGVSA